MDLVFACRRGRTVLAHAYAEPPFRVGRLLDAGPVAHMILVCSGPGIFTGDRLEQRVRVEPGARVLLVSQAALQLHPAAGGASRRARLELVVRDRRRCHARLLLGSGDSVRGRASEAADRPEHRRGRRDLLERRPDVRARRPRRNVGIRRTRSRAPRERRRLADLPGALRSRAPASRAVTHPWSAHRANYLGTTIVRSPAATAGRAEEAQRRLRTIDGLRAGVDCLEPHLVVGRLMAESGPPFASARAVLREVFDRPPLRRT